MAQSKKKEQCDQTSCDLCGRIMKSEGMEISYHSEMVLCVECLAEKESCGCEENEE